MAIFALPDIEPDYEAPSYEPTVDIALLLLMQGGTAASTGGGGSTGFADFWSALVARVAARVPALGVLWRDLAPDRVDGVPLAMPFGVYEDGAGLGFEFSTESPSIESGSASVSIYSADEDEARTLARAFRAAVKDAPLRFDEGRLMYLRVGTTFLPTLDPGPGPGGVDVYRALLTLDYAYVTTD